MTDDIFRFWAQVGPRDRIHPLDRPVFDRVRHNFNLECLPGCFAGPLRTARLVLLYLSPGISEFDLADAESQVGQDRYMRQRSGDAPLPDRHDYPSAWDWWQSRLSVLGDLENLRSSIAFLNICAYHSKEFKDWPLLAALPSSRAALEWAQTALFREAIDGSRVVICLRAARYWGLSERDEPYGSCLFAPPVTRSGYMKKGSARERIIALAKERLATTGKATDFQ
jgi:hypothetical protein